MRTKKHTIDAALSLEPVPGTPLEPRQSVCNGGALPAIVEERGDNVGIEIYRWLAHAFPPLAYRCSRGHSHSPAGPPRVKMQCAILDIPGHQPWNVER